MQDLNVETRRGTVLNGVLFYEPGCVHGEHCARLVERNFGQHERFFAT